MLERVADQVRQDHVQPARVEAGHDAARRVQLHRVQPGPRVHAGRDLVGDVDLVQHQPGGARVEAGDLHQVLHQFVQPPGLADHQPYGRARSSGRAPSASSSSTSVTAVIAVSGVRSSCDMSATKRRLASSRALSSSTRFSSASAALLNVRDSSASSSVPGDPQPGVQLALAEPPRRLAEPLHRPQHRGAAACASSAAPTSASSGGDPQRPGQRVEVLALGVQRLEHVAGRPAAVDPRARHQVRAALQSRSAARTGGTGLSSLACRLLHRASAATPARRPG